MKTIKEIAEILFKSNYLNIKISDKFIENIKFLPLGLIFLNRIKSEWYQSKGTINTYLIPNLNELNSKDLCSYIKSNEFHQHFLYIKNNYQKELPLAIKEELKFKLKSINEMNQIKNNKNVNNFNLNEYNNEDGDTILACTYFISEQLANEYFYKIQRERKIWWMKLSYNPGRYFLTDLKTTNSNINNIGGIGNNYKMHSIKIKSKFENFNDDLELENIHVIPLKALKLENQNDFYLKDMKINKRMIPIIIRTELNLEKATTGFLLDAIEKSKNGRMNIHRRIAPFQCSLLCLSEDEKILSELQELATHLTNVIRKSDISVLNLPKCSVTNESMLKNELHQMDKIGVPYNLILESNCLKDGLMKLRNRDTTLSETIHISDIPNYLIKIFISE